MSRVTVVFINILSGFCQHLSSSVTVSTLMIHRTGLGHTQFTLETIMSQYASLSTLLSQGTQQLAPGLSYPKGHVQWYTEVMYNGILRSCTMVY